METKALELLEKTPDRSNVAMGLSTLGNYYYKSGAYNNLKVVRNQIAVSSKNRLKANICRSSKWGR